MPTGYTAVIEDKDDVTFRQFALTCARAFGACVTQREESTDVPPRPRELDTWHPRELKKGKAELVAAERLTEAQAEAGAQEEFAWRQKLDAEAEASRALKNERYARMRAKVEGWRPPTKDHEDLKRFMLEQIDMCVAPPWEKTAKRVTGAEYKAARIEAAKRDVAYHEEQIRQDAERVATSNAWIEALYKSLPGEGR
jgi:hypothetical protein